MKTNAGRRQRVVLWLGVAGLGLLPLGPLSAQEPELRATLNAVPLPDRVWVNALAYRPDGKALAGACGMNTMNLRDTATLKGIATFRNDPVSSLGVSFWSVAFSPDAKTLVSANGHSLQGRLSENDAVQLWDADTGKKIATLEGHTDFVMWDVASGKNIANLKDEAEVWCVAFSADNKTIAAGGGKTVRLWDAATGKKTATLSAWTENYPPDCVRSVTFSPDGKTVAAGSMCQIKFWNVATGAKTAHFTAHPHWLTSVAFTPDGKNLASTSHLGNDHPLVKLWDLTTVKKDAK